MILVNKRVLAMECVEMEITHSALLWLLRHILAEQKVGEGKMKKEDLRRQLFLCFYLEEKYRENLVLCLHMFLGSGLKIGGNPRVTGPMIYESGGWFIEFPGGTPANLNINEMEIDKTVRAFSTEN
jgi:hypothetical protein